LEIKRLTKKHKEGLIAKYQHSFVEWHKNGGCSFVQ
jgi:hypothetical protein